MYEYDDEYLELFDSWMKDQGFTKRTQQAYLGDVRLFLSSVEKSLPTIEAIDIMRFLTKMRQGGAGDAARNRYLSSIRTFFAALIELQIVQSNPSLNVKKSKVEKNQIPTFLSEQLLVCVFTIDRREVSDSECGDVSIDELCRFACK